jgi:carbonic anhydrase/acetyltransferase-like protein (isoleucine patch superfamily)
MFYSFKGMRPVVHESAFVHPQANVTGDVWIGRDVYIGPGAVLRGDWGRITVGDGANVQENCIVHVFPGLDVVLEESAHIGHGAIVHGAHVGRNCLIGMNAVLMDKAVVGADSIVGALSFVPQGMQIPPRSVVVGNPARIIKEVSDEQLSWKTEGTAWYQALPKDCEQSLEECQPLKTDDLSRSRASEGYGPRGK